MQDSKPKEIDFIVHPDNWPALQIFLSCQTQWRYASAGVTGIDYNSVIQVLNLYLKKRKKRTFEDIQLIEFGALQSINKLKSK